MTARRRFLDKIGGVFHDIADRAGGAMRNEAGDAYAAHQAVTDLISVLKAIPAEVVTRLVTERGASSE